MERMERIERIERMERRRKKDLEENKLEKRFAFLSRQNSKGLNEMRWTHGQ